jgi:hypothetical protein
MYTTGITYDHFIEYLEHLMTEAHQAYMASEGRQIQVTRICFEVTRYILSHFETHYLDLTTDEHHIKLSQFITLDDLIQNIDTELLKVAEREERINREYAEKDGRGIWYSQNTKEEDILYIEKERELYSAIRSKITDLKTHALHIHRNSLS